MSFYLPLQLYSAPVPKKEDLLASSGWKDITVRIYGTDEKIIIPVMTSSKVYDVKKLFSEMHGGIDPAHLEFFYKLGPSYKRHRNNDEIAKSVFIKGIKCFIRDPIHEYNHPFLVVGAGFMGIRQAMHWVRQKIPFQLFEKNWKVGGNAWLTIGNVTSKLQTEGPQYQLQYDCFDKNVLGLYDLERYSYWPTRQEILDHMEETCDQLGVTPNMSFNCEIMEMVIHKPSNKDAPINDTYYAWEWESRKEGDDTKGTFISSVANFFPGCLVVPHRKTWPGEEVFEGVITYGFNQECDYTQCRLGTATTVLIGMGAFAHENVRTIIEHGGKKIYNIARHFNLIMPRIICWWINQSSCPPTAAMVLHAMEPMYKLVGLSPWEFFSVTANADRSVASIRQYTRWGISDIYIIAMYFQVLETVTGQVKRLKANSVVLDSGKILDDISMVIKVIGFDADFNIDRINQCKKHVGHWPNGDWRRAVQSDQSAIDASRFTNIALSPAVSFITFQNQIYFQHPELGIRVIESGTLPENFADIEHGSPCYHWEPRAGTTASMIIGSADPIFGMFDEKNNNMKKASHWFLADPDKYCKACELDWIAYCKIFKDNGIDQDMPWPTYPYRAKETKRLVRLEEELRLMEEQKWLKRMDIQGAGTPGVAQEFDENGAEQFIPDELIHHVRGLPYHIGCGEKHRAASVQGPNLKIDPTIAALQSQHASQELEARNNQEFTFPALEPGTDSSFEPARKVMLRRIYAQAPAGSDEECKQWLADGHEAKSYMQKNSPRASSPAALKNR